MRGLSGAPEPGRAWQLPPLRNPREELARCREQVLRLSHAIGADASWFQHFAWPLLLRWEALVAGLPAPCGEPDVLSQVLSSAAAAAETLPPEAAREAVQARLARAHHAAVRQAWWCARSVRLACADGRRWNPADRDARCWRAATPAPHWCECLDLVQTGDPWGGAAHALVRRGVWGGRPGQGRWLASREGWNLLWPLAGRDLVAAAAGAGRSLEPHHAAVLDGLPRALRAWGYLRGDGVPGPARRADGRTLTVLPVSARLRVRCGLVAGLPAQPDVVLEDRTR